MYSWFHSAAWRGFTQLALHRHFALLPTNNKHAILFGVSTSSAQQATIFGAFRIRDLYENTIIMLEDLLRPWVSIAALGAYISIRTIYRLYFHPLSHIPGPKLAACSHLYEFYYNVILSGKYLYEMEKMHQQYG